jgi:preprotein translocase subunit SecD
MKALIYIFVAMVAAVACASDTLQAFEMRITTNQPSTDNDTITITNPVTKVTEVIYVHKSPVIDETMVRSATVYTPEDDPYAYVEVVFTDMGRDRFASVTRQNIEKRIAIFIDGTLVVAPIIKAEITGGIFLLSGRMSEKEAAELTDKVNRAIKK